MIVAKYTRDNKSSAIILDVLHIVIVNNRNKEIYRSISLFNK